MLICPNCGSSNIEEEEMEVVIDYNDPSQYNGHGQRTEIEIVEVCGDCGFNPMN